MKEILNGSKKKENLDSGIKIEEESKIKKGLANLDEFLGAVAQCSNKEHANLVNEEGEDSCRVNITEKSGRKTWKEDMLRVSKQKQDFERMKHKEDKELVNHPLACEKVVTYLFAKYLGSNYLVVRASLYDDYFNGVDTLIIDKRNNRVICTLNEVCGSQERSRSQDKKDAVLERNLKGYHFDSDTDEKIEKGSDEHFGTFCAYGIKWDEESQSIKHHKIHDALVFSVPLKMKEIDDVLIGLSDDNSKLGGKESEIFNQCVDQLIIQVKTLQERVIAEIIGKLEKEGEKPEVLSRTVQMFDKVKSRSIEELQQQHPEFKWKAWQAYWENIASKKWMTMFLQAGELIKDFNQMKYKQKN